MKWKRGAGVRVFVMAWLALSAACRLSVAQVSASNNPLAGRWDLTLTTPDGELPSWIEVSFPGGDPKVLFVGAMDHAVPPKDLKIKASEFQFVSPKGEEGFPDDMLFRGKLVGDKLVGDVTDSAGAKWPLTGVRAPLLDAKAHRNGARRYSSSMESIFPVGRSAIQANRAAGKWSMENSSP